MFSVTFLFSKCDICALRYFGESAKGFVLHDFFKNLWTLITVFKQVWGLFTCHKRKISLTFVPVLPGSAKARLGRKRQVCIYIFSRHNLKI